MMQIHERIKNERVKQQLTEEELARRLKIKRSTYQYWETSTPSINKVKAVAKALGFDENYFFVTTEEPAKEEQGNDEYLVNQNNTNNEKHGAHVPGVILNGQAILVEAKELTASYERILEEKEARRIEAKERAERAEKERISYLR
jgi:transcriptional regulator with XRE-family HTH domain